MQEPTKIINEIREILFKYLDIQKVPDIMNDIRALFNEPENNSIPVELPSSVDEPDQPIFTIREVERMLADQRLSCMKQRYYNRYNGVKKMEEAILNAPPPQEFIDKIIVKIP